MSEPIYHPTDYRKNLVLYWQQFNPVYQIPPGYHVHHIRPRCTYTDPDDPCINHPRNLIALHPDDHQTIHICRGDTNVKGLLSVKDRRCRKLTRQRMSLVRGGDGIHVGYRARYDHLSEQHRQLKDQQDEEKYGMWITNGDINKRHSLDKTLPAGYQIGRSNNPG